MNGDEQMRLVLLGELAPLIEGNENVRVSGHENLVETGGIELVAQGLAEGEHCVLLDNAVLDRT